MIITNQQRVGCFTSSEIWALTTKDKKGTGFGKPALTYIDKKKRERRLGRSINTESNAKPLVWGNLLEGHVFDLLPLSYKLNSQETIVHPTIPFWSGSPDGENNDAVIDIKSPITLDSFCQLVDPLYEGLEGMDAMNKIRDTHKSGEDYYWQLLSNSILLEKDYAELIVYAPYLSELPAIRNLADGQGSAYWLTYSQDEELPYLLDGGYYNNINIIRFEVPQDDKDALTERVLEAGKLLVPRFEF